MEHTPYGYIIINGKAVIDEEEAENVRAVCENYLSGMSMVAAARSAGLSLQHSGVKKMMLNKRYLGDDFYPPILTAETTAAVLYEMQKREKNYAGIRKRKGYKLISVPKDFTMKKPSPRYTNPIKQAEYAYGLITER